VQQLQEPRTPAAQLDAVTDALLSASRGLVAVAARSLGGLDDDVTLPQYRALVVLAVHGDQHVGQLAEALDVHPSTMTRMCDRLVRKGLVTRRRSAGSRRATTISLSPAGQAVVDQVVAARRREIRRIVRRIPAEARTAAVEALTAFADAAGEDLTSGSELGWS